MRTSDYDGRGVDPPYYCQACVDKDVRIRELERQVEKLTVERDAFSGTACANGQLDGGGRCGICVRCKAHENAALRAVLRELPAWEIMRNRRRLRDHIAADCRERGVELEEKA